MTRKRSIVSRVASSRVVDDFKIIRGIGPLTEKHLHDAGIHTFAQLAKLSPEYVATHIHNVSASQIRNQGWILQAQKLASKKLEKKSGRTKTATSTTSQHYENFTLEFLLNEKNKFRRLRITHVQSGDIETWANWSPEEVIYFLARHTRTSLFQPAFVSKSEVPPSITKSEKVMDSPIVSTAVETAIQTPSQANPPKPEPQPISAAEVNQIQLLKWTNSLPNSTQPVNSLPHDQNFDMKLILDLTKTSLSTNTQLNMTGIIFAKKMGDRARQMISEAHNTVPYAPIIDLTISKASLPPGLYRLDAIIKLDPVGVKIPAIEANYRGELLQVY